MSDHDLYPGTCSTDYIGFIFGSDMAAFNLYYTFL